MNASIAFIKSQNFKSVYLHNQSPNATQRLVLRFINLSDSSYICTLIIDSTQGMYISVIGVESDQ